MHSPLNLNPTYQWLYATY
ncbi:hypothetical protein AZE42_13923 [Rhizopogon vesiculosus]|uniref:Uncharacterized protein n=1 Tax=Rhizopogon vesiculosus TaxID=180088 RepID=A0A1J8RIM0_9AGAM|nr:hypothetical protein AZE42_13923 [Rhizopogon vesiculosus]